MSSEKRPDGKPAEVIRDPVRFNEGAGEGSVQNPSLIPHGKLDPTPGFQQAGVVRQRGDRVLRISAITVPVGRRGCNPEKVKDLAVSLSEIGLIAPITVRSVQRNVDGVTRPVWELVAGAHRREAALLLRWQTIEVFTFTGSDDDARLYAIDENRCRTDLPVLDRCEDLAERVEILMRRSVSGHVGRKGKIGRPEGGAAQAARDLINPAASDEAGRKVVTRALLVAGIPDEAKLIARAAGFADNQRALLEIAAEKTPELKIKKAREIHERYSKPRVARLPKPHRNVPPVPITAVSAAAPRQQPDQSKDETAKAPMAQSNSQTASTANNMPGHAPNEDGIPEFLRRKAADDASQVELEFDELKTAWAKASPAARQRFVEYIRM
jgi:ParB-like chromosome segregation protein Spo0J